MRWNRILLFVLIAAALVFGLTAVRRSLSRTQRPEAQTAAAPKAQTSAGAYADPGSCAVCHDQIARTYSQTGMARSFAKLSPGAGPIADFSKRNRVTHAPSGREYLMSERDGKFYQRRHDIGFDGKESDVLELEANYVVGSGNHARTFVHRSEDGRLR